MSPVGPRTRESMFSTDCENRDFGRSPSLAQHHTASTRPGWLSVIAHVCDSPGVFCWGKCLQISCWDKSSFVSQSCAPFCPFSQPFHSISRPLHKVLHFLDILLLHHAHIWLTHTGPMFASPVGFCTALLGLCSLQPPGCPDPKERQHRTPTAPYFGSSELPLSISYFSSLSLGGFALVYPCSHCWGNTLCATRLQAANSLSPGPCGQLGSPPPASASPAGETPPLQPASPKQQDVANRLLWERVMRAGAWRRWCSGWAAPAPR